MAGGPPLDGVRVLDLTRRAPGPYCSMLLGDFGADVLLIEDPRSPSMRADFMRADPGARGQSEERALAHDALGRNKRSLCLDLKQEAGRAVLTRLAERADVVLEGFRPGVAERLGAGWSLLSARNPRLVYCSITGYGQDGPYAQLAGHDLDYLAVAGALGMIGRPPLNLLGDFAGGGLMAAFGIVMALLARERSGRGQRIDAAMTDGVMSLMANAASRFFLGGTVPRPGEHRLTGGSPRYDVYACRDGRQLAVAPLEDPFFEALCGALGCPELRGQPDDQIRRTLSERFATADRDHWVSVLFHLDACVAPVLALDEALADPHHRARAMVVEVDHPSLGPVPQVGVAPRLGDTPGAIRATAPRPGQHTDAVLAELGYDQSAIARLRADSVVA